MFFSNKNLISFSYFGRPWLHRIKFKLLKKEYKIFYVGSCLFSLPSIPTTLQALQPYQTTSVHNTLPISKLQSFILSGVTFPTLSGTPSAHLLKPSSSHLLQKALTFPEIHSPHALTSLCTYLY